MVAPFTLALASLDLITTDCRSPFVFKARLAENAGPLATTSMRSPSRCAGNFSGNVPAGFAPTATDGVRCQSRAGAHVKTITIAGTADIQLKIILLLQHVISCPAPDWLDRAIRKINRTASRPLTRYLIERACALCMPACIYQPKYKNKTCASHRVASG